MENARSPFLEFETNVPQQVALAYDDGRLTETQYGDKMFYRLMDGRTLSLHPTAAAKINLLEIRKGQPFMICRREVKDGRARKLVIDVWRPGADAIAPASSLAEIENSPLDQPGAGAVTPAPAAAAAKAEPLALSNGNGSTPAGPNGKSNGANGNGNGAARLPVYTPGQFVPPTKIPMDEAVVEAVRMVRHAMEVTNEQWSDASRQGLVSTILIAAQQRDWLTVWKREVTQ